MLIVLILGMTIILASGLICMVPKSSLLLGGKGFGANWHRVGKTSRLTMRIAKWTGHKPEFIIIAGKMLWIGVGGGCCGRGEL